MRHKALDFRGRAQLTELMDEPCTTEQLRDCLVDLARVNRWFLAYRPVLRWLDRMGLAGRDEPIRILDVGSGYGDGLRRVERWARERNIDVELTGLDLNPQTAAIAKEASNRSSRIEWVTSDVFVYKPVRKPHLVMSSLFTHHLGDRDVVRFVRWMDQNAAIGWFINDLSRAPIPFHLFRMFAKVARLHPFVQHDGPVSIARAFVAGDWAGYCSAAGLTSENYLIEAHKPARLCVSRRLRR